MDTFTLQDYIQLVEDDFQASKAIEQDSEFWFKVLRLYPDVKDAVVLNKNLPDSILMKLATDQDDRIRSLVAMKRRLPFDAFVLLSSDKEESIRMMVARNPKVPRDILLRMKEDSWEEVRSVVISRLEE